MLIWPVWHWKHDKKYSPSQDTASTPCPIFQSRRGGKWLHRVGFYQRVGSVQNHSELRGGFFNIIYIGPHGLKISCLRHRKTPQQCFQQHRDDWGGVGRSLVCLTAPASCVQHTALQTSKPVERGNVCVSENLASLREWWIPRCGVGKCCLRCQFWETRRLGLN